MSASQSYFVLQSTDGRRIELRGFSLRDNMVVSNAPAETNAAHKNQQIPLIPEIRPGNPINIAELRTFANQNGYSLWQTIDGVQTQLETELVNDLVLEVASAEEEVVLTWDSASVILSKSSSADGVFLTVFTGTSTGFTDTQVEVGDTWYYKIKKVVSAKTSAESAVVEAEVVEAA